MKALIISPHYLDENLGGPNCSKAIIAALSRIYPELTLIYPEHSEGTSLAPWLDAGRVTMIPCRDTRSRLCKLIDVYRGRLHRFTRPVQQELARTRYDVVFLNTTLVASSGVLEAVRKHGCRIVTLHHNVERDYMRDNPQPLAFRLPYHRCFLLAEEKALAHSHLNLTLTKADHTVFERLHPERRHTLATLGVFDYLSAQPQPATEGEPLTFVISGSLAAIQTETALHHFLQYYLPLLLQQCPGARLIITGRNPSSRLQSACKEHPCIELVPSPDDLLGVVARGTYYLAPIHTGSGLKLRIMDPHRLGLPVLAHEVSARGYEPIIAAGHMFAYTDAHSFLRQLQCLLDSTATRQEVVRSYYAHFSLEAGTQRLHRLLAERSML